MVGEHHDRLAVGRHLDRPLDQALAGQLGVRPRSQRATPRQPQPDPVPSRSTTHGPAVRRANASVSNQSARGPGRTRTRSAGRPVLGDVDRDRRRRIGADGERVAGADRRRAEPRQACRVDREPSTGSTSMPPRTATYDHVRSPGRPRTVDSAPAGKRAAAPARALVRDERPRPVTRARPVHRQVSIDGCPLVVADETVGEGRERRIDAPPSATPRWAKPGRPRSWIVVDPGRRSRAIDAHSTGRRPSADPSWRDDLTNLTSVPGSISAGGSRSASHTRRSSCRAGASHPVTRRGYTAGELAGDRHRAGRDPGARRRSPRQLQPLVEADEVRRTRA